MTTFYSVKIFTYSMLILQEMTQFDPPLTEIKTPHKDHENEFKYPPPPSTSSKVLRQKLLKNIWILNHYAFL